MGDVDASIHIFADMAVGRGRVASPTLSCLYPPGKYQYSCNKRLSGPWASLDEWIKKNLRPSFIRNRIRAVQPVPLRLAACCCYLTTDI